MRQKRTHTPSQRLRLERPADATGNAEKPHCTIAAAVGTLFESAILIPPVSDRRILQAWETGTSFSLATPFHLLFGDGAG